jgi:hypothetical protein
MSATRVFPGVLLTLAAFLSGACRAPAQAPAATKDAPAPREEIDKLIEQLGSDRFEAREEASRKLLALGEASLPALEKARRAADAEVRRRADRLAAVIGRLRQERLVRRLVADVNKGGIDQFIDHMVMRPGLATEQRWRQAEVLARAITLRASELAGRPFPAPRTRSRSLLQGRDGNGTSMRDCLCVCQGSIQYVTGLTNVILFINGDMKGCISVDNCVILCNGSIDRVASARNSVLVATGDFASPTDADNTFFQVKTLGEHARSHDNVYLNHWAVLATVSRNNNQFIRTERGPLQLFSFFDPARQGVTLAGDGSARLAKVHEGKPFARAGLRAGDVVLAVGRRQIDSGAALRARLRRLAGGDEVVFKVKRGDKVFETTVSLKE